jgi:heme/copper-type cytochrome/quinol oxidase subunit 3
MAAPVLVDPHAPLELAGVEPAPPARPRVLLVGTAFACAASAMFIFGMLGIYLNQRALGRAHGGTWLPQTVHIPLTQPNVMLFTLLMSSATITWLVYAIKADDRRHAYLAIGVSLLLAFAFLNQSAYLYSLISLDVHGNQQSVLIYTVTGAQLVMMIVAMIFVALMGFRALAGQFTSRQYDGITAAALYWQTAVAMYALIWYAIYVTK